MTEEDWANKALNYWADKKGMNENTLVKNPALEITIDSALVVGNLIVRTKSDFFGDVVKVFTISKD